MQTSATIVGVFTLGLLIGAVAASWLPGIGAGSEKRHTEVLIEELEADFGPARVQEAVERAQIRLDAAGHY